MARLTHRDFRSLLDCLGEIYALHDLNSFGPRATALSYKLVPSTYGSCSGVNPRTKRGWYVTCPAGLDFGFSKADMALITEIHPLITHYQRTRDGKARSISDFLSQPRYHESLLYREYFYRLSIEHMITIYLPDRPPDNVAIALIRDRRDFSERDRLVLNLLRPHLFQAYRNAELVAHLQEDSAQTTQALEAVSQGVVTLDARGHVRFCTPRARQWLATCFERPAHANGRLPDEVQCWLRRQQLPTTSSGTLPAPRQPLVMQRNGTQLTIRLLADAAPGRQTLVLEERRTELSATSLQSLGLTAREAEVLLWVAQGKTNPEIGMILGLSAGTVHKHTEHIFEKLGVETRTAAAACAWQVLGS